MFGGLAVRPRRGFLCGSLRAAWGVDGLHVLLPVNRRRASYSPEPVGRAAERAGP